MSWNIQASLGENGSPNVETCNVFNISPKCRNIEWWGAGKWKVLAEVPAFFLYPKLNILTNIKTTRLIRLEMPKVFQGIFWGSRVYFENLCTHCLHIVPKCPPLSPPLAIMTCRTLQNYHELYLLSGFRHKSLNGLPLGSKPIYWCTYSGPCSINANVYIMSYTYWVDLGTNH